MGVWQVWDLTEEEEEIRAKRWKEQESDGQPPGPSHPLDSATNVNQLATLEVKFIHVGFPDFKLKES